MTLCRTCLSKNDLKQLFPDKNLVSLRSEQLYLVCGVKIEEDDGLSQFICGSCLNLVNGALKLRESSSKAEEILKKSLTTIKIESDLKGSKKCYENNDYNNPNTKARLINKNESGNKKNNITSKKVSKKRRFNIKSSEGHIKNIYTVRIEDFESSNDSDFMNNFLVNDLESIQSSDDEKKVCIEDYESNDSLDVEFDSIIKKKSKELNMIQWDLKEKELLERERKRLQCKEQDEKLLSLAVTPLGGGGPIRCKLCSKEVRNMQNFKCHAKTHFEPQNACEECGKKFVNPSHMRYHQQRMHGRRKRLACSKCSYRAVDPLQLQNHERAEHTGERPYICDVCGDTFRMRANIAQHMRKHFGVRNLQCERCPAMFRSRSELTGHQNRVHYLVYTYLCYLCTETYKRPASVKKHLSNVHGVSKNLQLPIKCIKTRKRSCDRSE